MIATDHINESPELQPFDEHNQTLADNVHPQTWVNPTPSGRYNLVVIGAGTAGLVTAAGAAGLGAKVALIERNLMGGDCLNVGCVPSKAIISAARVAASVKNGDTFGVNVDGFQVDFGKVMERMRSLRAGISHHDSAKRFQELGVDVFIGSGNFTSSGTVEVGGQTLEFKRAVIATGARAANLPIPGLEDVNALTNETIFSLTELPARLTVIGGGPIGSEMAQSFARFGSQVTQIEKTEHILAREDADAAKVVQASMERDGVNFLTSANVKRFEMRGSDKVTIYEIDGVEKEVASDEILIGIGRTPNVDGMGLEKVGVKFDKRTGIEVNDKMQTANPMIYAAGDVASKFKFTHAADFLARIVIGNTLFKGRSKASNLVIPWATYTSPELAHVGMSTSDAAEAGIEIDTFTQQLSGVDRAILEGQTEGFARVHVKKGTDQIVGATIVAENAGDMISEFTLAMTNGIGLKKIGSTIHPYPTQAEVIRKLGDQFNKTRLTPMVSKLFKKWLAWTR
ncbi:Mercuric reductase [Rubripirellula obstinata]|uniref:Mercuric reductase n=1 Tax=Rubripirellula obstinata TaxID=406547 RepID=A0A5B1CI47_9BACT|nr:mercuric reductase [Rubripirellula obstinata]KAA1259902.1 Mercuric reductase [Rubripirellula obstinata]